MKTVSKFSIGVLAFTGIIANATASGVITDVSGKGVAGGSFGVLDNLLSPKRLNLTETFNSTNPFSLTFTVSHANGAGGPYSVTETITNRTGVAWSDFNFIISEPAQGSQGIVFNNFTSATLTGFSLDPSPSSGARELNFTGNLAPNASATLRFDLNVPDPGTGKNQVFTLTQTPNTSVVSPI